MNEEFIELSVRGKTEPLPKQKIFLYKTLEDPDVRYTWYVGGFGSGKTTVGVRAAIDLSMRYPKNRGVIARSKLTDLRATTMAKFKEIIEEDNLYPILEGGRWDTAFNTQDSLLKLVNGSEIYFWGLDYRSNEQLKSLELGWFYLDEVDEVPEIAFTILRGRLRKSNIPRRVGFITSNPAGQNWTYHYFVNHTIRDIEGQKRIKMDDSEQKKYFYIVAPTDENIYLPKDYIEELQRSYKGILYRRYVKGEFASFAGQIYDDLEASVHFIPRFEVPKEWYEYGVNGAMDYGQTSPTSFGRFAINPEDGSVILTDSYHMANSSISKTAEAIRKIYGKTDNEMIYIYAGHDTFNKTQQVSGEHKNDKELMSAADIFMNEYKITLIKAKIDVLPGIELVKMYLKRDPQRKHIIYKTSPAPKFYIFNDLQDVIDEMLAYRWNPEVPDTPIKRDDHAPDMIRYFLASSPLTQVTFRQRQQESPYDTRVIIKKSLQRLQNEVILGHEISPYGTNPDNYTLSL